jgi:DNA-binding MarR family transcriptional regulator
VKQTPELKLGLARQAVSTCACFNLRRASRALTMISDAALAPLQLSSGQFTLLVSVRIKGETSLLQLADMVWTDRSVLSRTVRPLEDRGLLKIVPGRDRRIRKVTLSPAGHRLLLRAHGIWQKTQARLGRRLGAGRLERLLGTLDQSLQNIPPRFSSQRPGVRSKPAVRRQR